MFPSSSRSRAGPRVAVVVAVLGALACTPRPSAQLAASPSAAETRALSESPAQTTGPAKPRWIDLSIEPEYGCAVERSGSVLCWGRGPAADMGLRELPEQAPFDPILGTRKWGPPSRLELIHDARAISTASSRACAIVEDGRVRCWGAVGWGSPHVYEVAGIHGAVELEIGEAESCARLVDGALWCWSAEDFGVPRLRLDHALAFTVADNLACGLARNGEISCWGQIIADWHRYDLQFRQQQAPNTLVGPNVGPDPAADAPSFPDFVSLGRFPGTVSLGLTGWNTLCLVRGDGRVACTEQDVSAQLRETKLALREVPGAEGVTALSSARTHSCALTDAGGGLCWGRNAYGQLGDGSSTTRDTAAPVAGLDQVLALAVAEDSSCAITRDDQLLCWGFDRGEALGRESLHVHTSTELGASSIAAAGRSTCVVDRDGALRCWGGDNIDALGILDLAAPTEVEASLGAELRGLSSGWEGCIHLADGELRCGNWAGLRLTVTTTLTGVTAYAAGAPPHCALVSDAKRKPELRCARAFAGLAHEPPVSPIKAPTALSAANMRACVVHGGGRLSCFAELYYWDDRPPPKREVVALEIRDAVSVASSTYQDCAVHKSGKLSCWVARTETQWSADGRVAESNRYVPGPIRDMGLTKVEEVVAGGQSLCARTSDGVVRCWSDNPYSEDIAWLAVPELPDDIVELAAGLEHSCARTRGGHVTCWGDDTLGQLGRIPSRVYLTPTPLQ